MSPARADLPGRYRWSGGLALPAALVLLIAVACAPSLPASGQATGQVSGPPVAPKVLVVGVQREPDHGEGSAANAGGALSVRSIASEGLTAETDLDVHTPKLALELPSIEKGTWRIHPDGTMETVWKLQPNARWHDGTPFTSEDLLFSFKVLKDPEVPTTSSYRRLLASAEAPDPQTYILHWSGPYVRAYHDVNGPSPRHLREELYLADKALYINTPTFTEEYVGLGPYRVAKWEFGSHIEFGRFDHYYRGRPPLDRIIARFIPDPNTLIANILAGELDAVLPVTVELEAALEVKKRWEGTGNDVRADVTGRLPQLEIQYRPDVVRPQNGLPNRTVRQAFYQAIDRQGLAETMTAGLSPVADSWYHPNFPDRTALEPFIPQFPYDLARAQQLLADAGWTRGPDGVLVHQPSGERFEMELWGLSGQGFGMERQLSIIAEGWKALGARISIYVVPPARISDGEHVSLRPGPIFTNPSGERFYTDRLHVAQLTSPATRWAGFNRGAYLNPRLDALLDRLTGTIDPRQRLPLHRELLDLQMGDIALMPLYWEVVPTLMVKGVKGPKHVRNISTHSVFEWEKASEK